MVLAAHTRGIRRVIVPEPQSREAAMVPGMEVLGLRSLAQVIAELKGAEVPEAPPVAPMSGQRLLSWRGQDRHEEVDLADLRGMHDARYAVEVAAAGGHHVMLAGPKGSGKTSLAERISGILPDLASDEALELTAIHSLAGALEPTDDVRVRPPFAAPHHSSSKAALLGGGSGRVRPGEISRSHCGVLFLDEFPLLAVDVIEALRQPLESGEVTIARGEETATFPARAMVVLAANPCPCGDFAPSQGENRCQCKETHRRDYRRKLSGPLLDRVDITRNLEPLQRHAGRDPFAVDESTVTVRARVTAARSRQAVRFAGRGWRLNSQVPGPQLAEHWPLAPEAARALEDELYDGRLTFRGAVRVHRLAWTVADLRGLPRPGPSELDIALGCEPASRCRCGRSSVPDERARVGTVRAGRAVPGRGARARQDARARQRARCNRRPRGPLAGVDGGDERDRLVAERLSAIDPAAELERARALRLRFVVPGDDEWPTRLDDLRFVDALHERSGVPLGLWVKGPMRLDTLDESVSVVGARSASTYGATVSGEIACTAARWVGRRCPARRSESTKRPTEARSPGTAGLLRCSPAERTGSTRERTESFSSTSGPITPWSRRPPRAGRPRGSGFWPATG